VWQERFRLSHGVSIDLRTGAMAMHRQAQTHHTAPVVLWSLL
jgi:hypothetical protein